MGRSTVSAVVRGREKLRRENTPGREERNDRELTPAQQKMVAAYEFHTGAGS
jgi:hypothetical protein